MLHISRGSLEHVPWDSLSNLTPLGLGGTGAVVGFGVAPRNADGLGIARVGSTVGGGVAGGDADVVSGASEPAPAGAHPAMMATIAITATAPSARLPTT
jgi:hypothetical protein